MSNVLAKEFSFKELLKFSFPSIVMMMFMSLYTIIDGFFVSRFVGAEALSAVNIVYPLINVVIAVGLMFATGGSAIVALQMGEGKRDIAKANFTLIIGAAVVLAVILGVISIVSLDSVVRFLGAKGSLIALCKEYLVILMIFAPVSILQLLFQSFFVTAGRPHLGLGLTVAGGLFNMAFDYILIVPMNMGIAGAAYATAASYFIPAIGGLVFFARNKSGLSFSRPVLRWKILWESCLNGSSEMVTNLSGSATTLLFNILMMKYAGADGVAAITAVLYSQFLMSSLFLGFSIGVAPIISYHYGAGNKAFLEKTFKRCAIFICVVSVIIFGVSFGGSGLIAGIFFPSGLAVHTLAVQGLRIFSVSFLFAGINIFASALFTALGNGKISAAISFSRTFLFTIAGILVLSRLFEINGLWIASPFAELCTVAVVLLFFKELKRVVKA